MVLTWAASSHVGQLCYKAEGTETCPASWVPGTLCTLSFNPTTNPRNRHYYPYFTDGETEAPRS